MRAISMAGPVVAGLLGCALTVALPASGHATTIDDIFGLNLNGMSSGTCPLGSCGQVEVTGDPTSSLTYTVTLATGVSFHGDHSDRSGTGPVLYFELTDPPGSPAITFSGVGTSGTIGSTSYSYNSPVSGSFDPNPGNFPGSYDYEVTCTNNTTGKICNGPLTFTANGADSSDPFLIGAPSGHGSFASDAIAFVADLSISGSCGTESCTAGTGLVGSSLLSSTTTQLTTPLPSSWIALLAGLAAFAFAGYRRQGRRTLFGAAA